VAQWHSAGLGGPVRPDKYTFAVVTPDNEASVLTRLRPLTQGRVLGGVPV